MVHQVLKIIFILKKSVNLKEMTGIRSQDPDPHQN